LSAISFQDPALPLYPALSSFVSPFRIWPRILPRLIRRRSPQPPLSPLHSPQNSSNYLLLHFTFT